MSCLYQTPADQEAISLFYMLSAIIRKPDALFRRWSIHFNHTGGQPIATPPALPIDGQSLLLHKQGETTLQSTGRGLPLQHTADLLKRGPLGKSSTTWRIASSSCCDTFWACEPRHGMLLTIAPEKVVEVAQFDYCATSSGAQEVWFSRLRLPLKGELHDNRVDAHERALRCSEREAFL
jgi:hypothetical protein